MIGLNRILARILSFFASAVMLASCSGVNELSGDTPVTLPVRAVNDGVPSVRTDTGIHVPLIPSAQKAWMSPAAIRVKHLLYISDPFGLSVWVYSWPKKILVGVLTGFHVGYGPQGECADASGNVYITNPGSSEILEYKSGAPEPFRTIQDSDEFPDDCAVDPKTGDLAVANFEAFQSGVGGEGNGSISVYNHAVGKPKTYSDSAMPTPFFLSYDNDGTVWVDGSSITDTTKNFPIFAYASLRPGTGKFTNETLKGPGVHFPGGVQFDGHQITVGDQGLGVASIIYRTQGFGITGTTVLHGSTDVVQYTIDGNMLIGPDDATTYTEIYKMLEGEGPWYVLRGADNDDGKFGSAITSVSTK